MNLNRKRDSCGCVSEDERTLLRIEHARVTREIRVRDPGRFIA